MRGAKLCVDMAALGGALCTGGSEVGEQAHRRKQESNSQTILRAEETKQKVLPTSPELILLFLLFEMCMWNLLHVPDRRGADR